MSATVRVLKSRVNGNLPFRDGPGPGTHVWDVDMQTTALEATGVVRANSLDFVEQVFALYDADEPLVMLSDAGQTTHLPGIVIGRCVVPSIKTGWFTARHAIRDTDLIAQVIFTSGTEGHSKGIVLTQANLADATRRIIDAMQMTAEVREYVGVPATFSFGLARYRAVSAVGGHAYMPPHGFDPVEFSRMLAAGQINALSVVPTLLRVLLASPEVIGTAGEKLRWMEIGSQPMTAEEKQAIKVMFPKARIIQHYGLTEASRTTFLNLSDSEPARLGSVGKPAGNTEVSIDLDGHIRIRGPHVAVARIDADGLHDLCDAEGWLRTNDLGHMLDGYLYFDGRADDLINCGGVKIVPDQLESLLSAHLAPDAEISVARIPDADRGDGVLLAVAGAAKQTEDLRRLAQRTLRDMGVAANDALQIMIVDTIPRTETGKVQRHLLAEQFMKAKEGAVPVHAKKGTVTDVRSLFEHQFPSQTVSDDDTFTSLGGDSLHFIKFSMAFEKRFGALPENWETLSAQQLQNHIAGTPKSSWLSLETVTLTRAFFILCIVGLHTHAFTYSSNWGAAYFLIILAGYSVARFQLPEIIRTGSVRTLIGTVASVAVPTILFIALLEFVTDDFNVMQLLLVSNFMDPRNIHGFLFYFIEFYVQLLLLTAVLFLIPQVRKAFKDRPMLSAVLFLVFIVALDHGIDVFWDTDYNFHRTPWHYAWPFVVGIIIAKAKDMPSRIVALIAATIAALIQWQLTSATLYVVGGCIVILFVRSIRLPAAVNMLIANIAAASIFIFLCHDVIHQFIKKILLQEYPWFAFSLSIVIGILGMQVYGYVERQFLKMKKDFTAQS